MIVIVFNIFFSSLSFVPLQIGSQATTERSRQDSLIEIEFSTSSMEDVDGVMSSPLVPSQSTSVELETKAADRRESLLKIIETDDES